MRSLYLAMILLSSAHLCAFPFKKSEETRSAKEQKTIPILPGYEAPSRLSVRNPVDMYTSFSFIYWQPSQEAMELGVVADDSFNSLLGNLVNLDFDYTPGFQIGVGVNLDHDAWEIASEYTWLRSHNQTQKTLDSSNSNVVIYPFWTISDLVNVGQFFSAEELWQLEMDLIDVNLIRRAYYGECLTVAPFLGLRSAFIRQYSQARYLDEVTGFKTWHNLFMTQKTHSWGVGPEMGLRTEWRLGQGFWLYGDGSCDLLFTQYTHLATKQLASGITNAYIPGSLYLIEQNNVNTLRAHLDLELGFGWGRYIRDQRYHLSFTAGYGFQVFFRQNVFRNFVANQQVGKSVDPNGDLYIQGMTLSGRFDF